MSETLRGAVFIEEAEDISREALLATLREDGTVDATDPCTLDGFDEGGRVGVAIEGPTNGFFTIVDSADGCQGIGSGGWSRIALIANHKGTRAFWYRAYSDQVALGVRYNRGGRFFLAYPGSRAEVLKWLRGFNLPLDAARPPRTADAESVVATIRYEAAKYRSGPTEDTVKQLIAVHDALVAGDADALSLECEQLDEDALPFGLAVIRAAHRGQWQSCLERFSRRILDAPIVLRAHIGDMTLAEDVLRRVAEFGDDDAFAACMQRLDDIEADAERRSSHAHPAGVERLAYRFQKTHPRRAARCFLHLVRRTSEPHWLHVNQSLYNILVSTEGVISLEGDTAEAVQLALARLSDLGSGAGDSVCYNLACVYARAGELESALSTLRRIRKIRDLNPHPEQDPDFKALWSDAAFQEILQPERGDSGYRSMRWS